MNDPNKGRPGYKQTKVGWIPEEWKPGRVQDFGRVVTGSTPSTDKPSLYGGNFLFAAPSDLGLRKCVEATQTTLSHDGFVSCRKLPKGSVLFVSIGSTIGKVGMAGTELATNQQINAIIPNNDNSPEYLYYILSHRGRHIASLAACQAVPIINKTEFEKILIPLPPLPEQQKIAAVLAHWDDAIEQTRDLIAAKKQQKKALMQQLLTGKRRLPGFEGERTSQHLSSVVVRIKETADDPTKYPVLSITAGTGFVSQADKFSRVIAGKHIENYILLRRGEFSYNKGNSYRYPQGCVYQLHEYDEGLVPSVFYSFRVKPKKIHDAFLKHYFIAGLHNEQIYRWINTGVRNNGLLNLSASDFFALEISLPPLDEQRAIAAVLDTADHELKSLEDKLAGLKEQKKGLMQKLLTGEVRVRT